VPPKAATHPAEEARLLELVNQFRSGFCAPLKLDGRLTRAAQDHSSDMADQGYFSHTGRDGRDAAQRMRDAGYSNPGGENLAQGPRSPEDAFRMWMNSSGHRDNIMNCSYTTMGLGLDTRGWYWTQDFGR
jgi:uncharacterized protein YkwD